MARGLHRAHHNRRMAAARRDMARFARLTLRQQEEELGLPRGALSTPCPPEEDNLPWEEQETDGREAA